MTGDVLSGGISERLRWAIREATVIAGILVFWLLAGIVLMAGVRIFTIILYWIGVEPIPFLYDLRGPLRGVWTAIVPLASATTALYVLVRAGTLLIDRYQASLGS